jgi:alkylhydroperoxidase/carboxymuconolactone decarboxylase family protein YurZ
MGGAHDAYSGRAPVMNTPSSAEGWRERARAADPRFAAKLEDLLTHINGPDFLDRRSRELVTLSAVVALRYRAGVDRHLQTCADAGIARSEVLGTLLLAGLEAGVPALFEALQAFAAQPVPDPASSADG